MELQLKGKREQFEGTFYWDGDKEKMWIKLAVLPDEEMREMTKKFTKTLVDFALNPETGRMERVETIKTDHEKIAEMMQENCWIGWGNFTINGEELEFTPENKEMVMKGVDGFETFYTKSFIALTENFREKFGSKEKTKN